MPKTFPESYLKPPAPGTVPQERDRAVNELHAVLLQISLAVMLIFMIAFFLFMSKVGGRLSNVDQLQKTVDNARKREILHSVEQIAEKYRIRYGLKAFLVIDPVSGEKRYDFPDILARQDPEGPARRSFRLGAGAAWSDYSDPAALEQCWLRDLDALVPEAAAEDPVFLREQVRSAIGRLRREVTEVQTLAAASLQHRYAEHPEEVRDPAVQELIRDVARTSPGMDRKARVQALSARLQSYVYTRLAAEFGASMLKMEE